MDDYKDVTAQKVALVKQTQSHPFLVDHTGTYFRECTTYIANTDVAVTTDSRDSRHAWKEVKPTACLDMLRATFGPGSS